MKKVLVLAAAIALLAAPAFAGIRNTKHDLSNTSSDTGVNGTSGEICVYCHTPHAGLAGGFAPLWNRTGGVISAVYNSSTLDVNPTVAAAQASDALLCMTCHDGASLNAALKNPPNSAGGANVNPASNLSANSNTNLDDGATSLTNDHPVAFVYPGSDTEVRGTPNLNLDVTYGAGNNEMWCSSCHDVHDNTVAPFLATTNAASALCLACHIK